MAKWTYKIEMDDPHKHGWPGYKRRHTAQTMQDLLNEHAGFRALNVKVHTPRPDKRLKQSASVISRLLLVVSKPSPGLEDEALELINLLEGHHG